MWFWPNTWESVHTWRGKVESCLISFQYTEVKIWILCAREEMSTFSGIIGTLLMFVCWTHRQACLVELHWGWNNSDQMTMAMLSSLYANLKKHTVFCVCIFLSDKQLSNIYTLLPKHEPYISLGRAMDGMAICTLVLKKKKCKQIHRKLRQQKHLVGGRNSAWYPWVVPINWSDNILVASPPCVIHRVKLRYLTHWEWEWVVNADSRRKSAGVRAPHCQEGSFNILFSTQVKKDACGLNTKLSKGDTWYVWSTVKSIETTTREHCVLTRFLCNDNDTRVTREFRSCAHLMIESVTSVAQEV